MSQLLLPFPKYTSFLEDDFIQAPCNMVAVRELFAPFSGIKILCGPRASGKTHLAHIFKEKHSGILLNCAYPQPREIIQEALSSSAPLILDNVERLRTKAIPESFLFHTLESMLRSERMVLLTSRIFPQQSGVKTPDLQSRLMAISLLRLSTPDESLLVTVLTKLLHERHVSLKLQPALYLIRRIPRSFRAVKLWARRIDEASLAYGRGITIPFLGKLLEQHEEKQGSLETLLC